METPLDAEIMFQSFTRQSVECGAREIFMINCVEPMRVTGLAVNRTCSASFLIRGMSVGITNVIRGPVDACAYETPGKALPGGLQLFLLPGQTVSIEVENISQTSEIFSAWIAYWPVLDRQFQQGSTYKPVPVLRDPGPSPSSPPPALGRELPSRKFSFDEE